MTDHPLCVSSLVEPTELQWLSPPSRASAVHKLMHSLPRPATLRSGFASAAHCITDAGAPTVDARVAAEPFMFGLATKYCEASTEQAYLVFMLSSWKPRIAASVLYTGGAALNTVLVKPAGNAPVIYCAILLTAIGGALHAGIIRYLTRTAKPLSVFSPAPGHADASMERATLVCYWGGLALHAIAIVWGKRDCYLLPSDDERFSQCHRVFGTEANILIVQIGLCLLSPIRVHLTAAALFGVFVVFVACNIVFNFSDNKRFLTTIPFMLLHAMVCLALSRAAELALRRSFEVTVAAEALTLELDELRNVAQQAAERRIPTHVLENFSGATSITRSGVVACFGISSLPLWSEGRSPIDVVNALMYVFDGAEVALRRLIENRVAGDALCVTRINTLGETLMFTIHSNAVCANDPPVSTLIGLIWPYLKSAVEKMDERCVQLQDPQQAASLNLMQHVETRRGHTSSAVVMLSSTLAVTAGSFFLHALPAAAAIIASGDTVTGCELKSHQLMCARDTNGPSVWMSEQFARDALHRTDRRAVARNTSSPSRSTQRDEQTNPLQVEPTHTIDFLGQRVVRTDTTPTRSTSTARGAASELLSATVSFGSQRVSERSSARTLDPVVTQRAGLPSPLRSGSHRSSKLSSNGSAAGGASLPRSENAASVASMAGPVSCRCRSCSVVGVLFGRGVFLDEVVEQSYQKSLRISDRTRAALLNGAVLSLMFAAAMLAACAVYGTWSLSWDAPMAYVCGELCIALALLAVVTRFKQRRLPAGVIEAMYYVFAACVMFSSVLMSPSSESVIGLSSAPWCILLVSLTLQRPLWFPPLWMGMLEALLGGIVCIRALTRNEKEGTSARIELFQGVFLIVSQLIVRPLLDIDQRERYAAERMLEAEAGMLAENVQVVLKLLQQLVPQEESQRILLRRGRRASYAGWRPRCALPSAMTSTVVSTAVEERAFAVLAITGSSEGLLISETNAPSASTSPVSGVDFPDASPRHFPSSSAQCSDLIDLIRKQLHISEAVGVHLPTPVLVKFCGETLLVAAASASHHSRRDAVVCVINAVRQIRAAIHLQGGGRSLRGWVGWSPVVGATVGNYSPTFEWYAPAVTTGTCLLRSPLADGLIANGDVYVSETASDAVPVEESTQQLGPRQLWGVSGIGRVVARKLLDLDA